MHDPNIQHIDDCVVITNPTADHWYPSWKDGRPLVSVTMCTNAYPIGEWLKRWLGNADSYKEAEQKKEEGGKRGTRVHDACEDILRGGSLEYEAYAAQCPSLDQSIKEWRMIEGFYSFLKENAPEICVFDTEEHAIEVEVQSEEYEYAGKFDFACMIDGTLHIVDIKTSGGIYPKFWIQVNAYWKACEEMGLFNGVDSPVRLSILRLKELGRTSFYELKSQAPSKEEFDIFKACKDLYHHSSPAQKGPKVIELKSTLSYKSTVYPVGEASKELKPKTNAV